MVDDLDGRQLSHPSTNGRAPSGAGVHIRPLESMEDCRACVGLQHEVWGYGDGQVVPATLLHVVGQVAGVAAGAFAPDGELVGFVFGISGVKDGEPAHWSHMLAVREPARNAGVGRMLKEYQRAELARLGIGCIYWSFDPLMAKNAHLNLNRLGARIVEYVPDMYGSSPSPLHYGLATDRLVVRLMTNPPAGAEPVPAPVVAGSPVRSPFPRAGDTAACADEALPPEILLEIPAEIGDVLADAPSAAIAWRLAVRQHFQWALQNGYTATLLHCDPAERRAFYVLTREPFGRS